MNFAKLLLLLCFAAMILACGQNSTSERPAPTPGDQPVAAQPQESASAPKAETAQQSEPSAQQTTPPAQTQETRYRIPAYYENPDDAEPLAPILDPNTVPVEAQFAYKVAQENPRLMAQLPCFCYCDRMGHKSLHDCFSGTHAESCDTCMNEAIEASQMAAQGLTPQQIREAIIAKHHPRVNDAE